MLNPKNQQANLGIVRSKNAQFSGFYECINFFKDADGFLTPRPPLFPTDLSINGYTIERVFPSGRDGTGEVCVVLKKGTNYFLSYSFSEPIAEILASDITQALFFGGKILLGTSRGYSMVVDWNLVSGYQDLYEQRCEWSEIHVHSFRERYGRVVGYQKGTSTVRFSAVGDIKDFGETYHSIQNPIGSFFVDVGYADTSRIVSMVFVSSDIVVFKSSGNIYRISGTNPGNIGVTMVASGFEKFTDNCAIMIGDQNFFVHSGYIYSIGVDDTYGQIQTNKTNFPRLPFSPDVLKMANLPSFPYMFLFPEAASTTIYALSSMTGDLYQWDFKDPVYDIFEANSQLYALQLVDGVKRIFHFPMSGYFSDSLGDMSDPFNIEDRPECSFQTKSLDPDLNINIKRCQFYGKGTGIDKGYFSLFGKRLPIKWGDAYDTREWLPDLPNSAEDDTSWLLDPAGIDPDTTEFIVLGTFPNTRLHYPMDGPDWDSSESEQTLFGGQADTIRSMNYLLSRGKSLVFGFDANITMAKIDHVQLDMNPVAGGLEK